MFSVLYYCMKEIKKFVPSAQRNREKRNYFCFLGLISTVCLCLDLIRSVRETVLLRTQAHMNKYIGWVAQRFVVFDTQVKTLVIRPNEW
jgi:hypothetical protein